MFKNTSFMYTDTFKYCSLLFSHAYKKKKRKPLSSSVKPPLLYWFLNIHLCGQAEQRGFLENRQRGSGYWITNWSLDEASQNDSHSLSPTNQRKQEANSRSCDWSDAMICAQVTKLNSRETTRRLSMQAECPCSVDEWSHPMQISHALLFSSKISIPCLYFYQ